MPVMPPLDTKNNFSLAESELVGQKNRKEEFEPFSCSGITGGDMTGGKEYFGIKLKLWCPIENGPSKFVSDHFSG